MKVALVTLFPEMFIAISEYGVSGRAVKQGLVELQCWNPRDYAVDRHQTVDDRPYGGGPGMLMMIQPLEDAIKDARTWVTADSDKPVKVIYLSPQGRPLDQAGAESLAGLGEGNQCYNLVLVAGRYEGVDERLIQAQIDEEWSIGDYVLSGGELAAMVLIDSVIRLIPGVLGHAKSAVEDSFSEGLLDCPHYTRPEIYQGQQVPDVLLSGNHEKIRLWRLKQALGRTWLRRPDLLSEKQLTEEQQTLLTDYRRDLDSENY
jgi:tRNA (guanine37-N1)-methyltransferase